MLYVEYVGKAHQRVITPHDWRSIGISDGTMFAWNAFNGFALRADLFTENQIARAITPDPDFVVRDFEPARGPYDMTPSELRQFIENPVDVLDMLNEMATPAPATSEAPNGGRADDADTDDGHLEDMDDEDTEQDRPR
jgi:hypothetical protein